MLQRRPPQSRGFKPQPERVRLRDIEREPQRLVREVSFVGGTTGAQPKNPADRLQAFRDLAMGEECQVRYAPVCRHPATEYTVLAHTNTQADQKGMGYKGHDSEGMFACDRCHSMLDADRGLLSAMQLEEIGRSAQERTRIRLRFIANSITERPWRVRAAKWALEQQDSRK